MSAMTCTGAAPFGPGEDGLPQSLRERGCYVTSSRSTGRNRHGGAVRRDPSGR